MSSILLLSGSPSTPSRSEAVLHHAAGILSDLGLTTQFVSVRDLPPEDLALAKFDSPQLKAIQQKVAQARCREFESHRPLSPTNRQNPLPTSIPGIGL